MKRAGWVGGKLFSFAILVALASCCQNPTQTTRKPYLGPTIPIDQLVTAVNQNNQKITTLWAHVSDFNASFTDNKTGEVHKVDGDGSLVYAAPGSIHFVAKNPVYDIFDLGSDGQKYWFWLQHINRVWWGTYTNLDRVNSKQIPVRPELVLEVLGIRPIETDMNSVPVPVMRFNNEEDAYMLVWQTHLPQNWAAEKEIWYDRATLMPKMVKLYDLETGRVMLRADLSKYGKTKMDQAPQDQWPSMATHFDLSFPDSGATMSFNLSNVALTRNGFPKAISFQMPEWTPADEVIPIQ